MPATVRPTAHECVHLVPCDHVLSSNIVAATPFNPP